MKITYIAIALVLAMLLLSGCVQPTPPAPTPTPAPIVGGDVDEYGCIPSAGYTWCEPKQKCIREWEEECDETQELEQLAGGFCNKPNVDTIYVCENYIQVVSKLIGGESTYYTVKDGALDAGVQCPDESGAMSVKCKTFFQGENCVEKICEPPIEGTEYYAQAFCGQPNVAAVYVCGEYARTVSSLEGGGSTFYKLEADGSWGDEVQCPLVAPSAMSEECVLLTMGSNCIETQIC